MNIDCTSSQDRQTSQRSEPSQTVRVRPFDTRYSVDVCNTKEILEGGLYFETPLGHYYEGMNVSLARSFQLADLTHREEIAKIVSLNKLSDGRWGVGIRIL